MASINYINERVVEEEDLSLTLLQIRRKNGIAHMHVCGGMARCSTCRVMVLEHPENIEPRNLAERNLATAFGLRREHPPRVPIAYHRDRFPFDG